MPRRPSAIEISLDTMPQIPTAIAYGVTCWPLFWKKSWYCRSPTSMPPPPLPMITPALGSANDRPASFHASRAAMHAEERRARIALGIGARLARAQLALERHRRRDVDGGHRRGHLAGIGRGVEFGDRARAALAAADRVPEHFAAGAERRDDADPVIATRGWRSLNRSYNSARDEALPLERRALFLLSLLSFAVVYGWRLAHAGAAG